MGKWSNLTQREKSNIIRFAIKNGVSDINTIRDTFNVYISGNGGENEYKEGGSIHIKHPGRLTALKERTGKTEAELWATGSAHTKKMITFARNARKWHKHEDGGDNNTEYSVIDYLRDLRNLLNSKEEDRLTSNISLSPDFYNKSIELASSPLYKPILKRVAERAMHQSSYPTRSIENFKKAIFEPDTYKYTGGVDYYSGGWDNRKRDLVSLFINGKPDRNSDLQSLEGEDSRGFDYSNFIATHYPNKTIKTYEGIFPLRGIIQVSPSGYELAKFLGSNLSNVGHYKNAGLAPSTSDNVASYRTHYNVWKGEPELIQTDLWDFGGNYNNIWNSKNSDFKRLQSEVVNTIGTPFILKSINPIRVSSTPDEEFENQMAREADATNVLRYDSNSDTYNILLSLPELTVGRLRNFMFEEGERAKTLSTGGPLYPFSFSKNPYWKTPVVRYDNGGDINRESEFLPNENIQNIKVWLNKGTKFQKQRPGTVNLQNIVEALNPNGPDNQYVWDNAEHTSYSAFRRNPDYRAPAIPTINNDTSTIGLNISKYIEKAPGIYLSPEYILNNLPNFKIPPVSIPLPKRNNQNLNGNWIQQESMWNPAYGYETFHLENSPYYGIKYYSIPGAVNAGQGSSAVLDSTIIGIPIQELNNRIFDYRTQNGGWSSFNPPTN